DQEHDLAIQEMRLREDALQGQLDIRKSTIDNLERLIAEQQLIVDSHPEGSKERDEALNHIAWYQDQIRKQWNDIEYLAGQFANTTYDITDTGRESFATQARDASLERQGTDLERAETLYD